MIIEYVQNEFVTQLVIWPYVRQAFAAHITISAEYIFGDEYVEGVAVVIRPSISMTKSFVPEEIKHIGDVLTRAAGIAQGHIMVADGEVAPGTIRAFWDEVETKRAKIVANAAGASPEA